MVSATYKKIALGLTVAALAAALCAVAPALSHADTDASGKQVTQVPADDERSTPVVASGWSGSGKVWQYYSNSKPVKGRWVVTATAPMKGSKSGKQRYWVDADGYLAVSRLVDPTSDRDAKAGYWAYATAKGYVARGKHVVGSKVYLANNDGKLEEGNAKGFLVTKKYDGGKAQRYLIDKQAHAALTGTVVKVKGYGSVYGVPKKGYVLRGLYKVNSTHMLAADNDGKLYTGKKGFVYSAKYTSGSTKHRYYFEPVEKGSSTMGARIGVFKVGGKLYKGSAYGYLSRNVYTEVDGKYYYANGSGVLDRSKGKAIDKMVKRAKNTYSPSRYLLMVDVDDCVMVVFQGKKGAWKIKCVWRCATGKPSTPTVTGTFHVAAKGYSFGEEHGYSCYYWTQFYGGYLFHSRKYWPHTHNLRDSRIGKRISKGCVRLYDENAIWIQKNASAGTTVVTMK